MTTYNFIKECAKGTNDPSFNVTNAQEWRELIEFQASELFPEIAIEGSYSIVYTDISNYEVDLSVSTYDNVENVKEILLETANGDRVSYDNWIYNKETKRLDLDPETSKVPDYDPSTYINVIIVTNESLPALTSDSTDIDLKSAELILLKKVCIKEAIRRILLDHTKLDRYRTLVGRTNEYALLGIIRDLTLEIERGKAKLTNTNSVRTF